MFSCEKSIFEKKTGSCEECNNITIPYPIFTHSLNFHFGILEKWLLRRGVCLQEVVVAEERSLQLEVPLNKNVDSTGSGCHGHNVFTLIDF